MSIREHKFYEAKHPGTVNFCHPANMFYSYDNYLIGIVKHKVYNEFNFMMSEGSISAGMSSEES